MAPGDEERFDSWLRPSLEPRNELAKSRLKICGECEFFRPVSKTCMKCNCFMVLKTHLPSASCPIGKW